MSYLYDYAIIGGDNRQLFLADLLTQTGGSVCYYGLSPCALPCKYIPCFMNKTIVASQSLQDAVEHSRIIIGPVPFTKDKTYLTSDSSLGILVEDVLNLLRPDQILYAGAISKQLMDKSKELGLKFIDIMKFEPVSLLNAIATAEGAICEAIRHSIINIQGSNILVLGFGRCGQILAKKLAALDGNVTVSIRKEESMSLALAYGYESFLLKDLKDQISNYHFIFNTIPAMVLTQDILKQVPEETAIIDIASAPGGVDFNYTNDHCYNAGLYLGLPGKMSPKSSAKILLDAILQDCKKKI